MKYAGLIKFDTGNSHGISTTLFVQGCSNRCEGCHNPSTWDPSGGEEFTKEIEDDIIESLKNPYVHYFVLSGGDPFYPGNRQETWRLLKRVREETDVKIIVYTGYRIQDLLGDPIVDSLLQNMYINYIIDGKYDKNNPTRERDLRGSTNQQCWMVDPINLINISETYFKK